MAPSRGFPPTHRPGPPSGPGGGRSTVTTHRSRSAASLEACARRLSRRHRRPPPALTQCRHSGAAGRRLLAVLERKSGRSAMPRPLPSDDPLCPESDEPLLGHSQAMTRPLPRPRPRPASSVKRLAPRHPCRRTPARLRTVHPRPALRRIRPAGPVSPIALPGPGRAGPATPAAVERGVPAHARGDAHEAQENPPPLPSPVRVGLGRDRRPGPAAPGHVTPVMSRRLFASSAAGAPRRPRAARSLPESLAPRHGPPCPGGPRPRPPIRPHALYKTAARRGGGQHPSRRSARLALATTCRPTP